MNTFIVRAVTISLIVGVSSGCAAYSLSRMGSSRPSKAPHCDVEILEPSRIPERPYVNVGMVHLKHCADYQTPPCSDWLRQGACELGGDVAWHPMDYARDGRDDALAGPVTVTVTVAIYAGNTQLDTDGSMATVGATSCDDATDDASLEMDGDPDMNVCRE